MQHFKMLFKGPIEIFLLHFHRIPFHEIYFVCFVRFREEQAMRLDAGESAFYTWHDPCSDRELIWSCGKSKDNKDELLKVSLTHSSENFFLQN